MEHAQQYRRLQAPEQDGGTLVEPPWRELTAIVAANRTRIRSEDVSIGEQCLANLAASARSSLLAAAKRYTGRYANLPNEPNGVAQNDLPPVILAGHQPQIFHPGVWYKNFALARLAKQVGAWGLNLVIDSDLCRATSIRVPTGSIDSPRAETIVYDRPLDDRPYEERQIADVATFGNFAERTNACIRPMVANPIIDEYWSHVLRSRKVESNLGRCLSQGRHILESEWRDVDYPMCGGTLELPQSSVCELPEFHLFAAHVLVSLPRFVAAHNTALYLYRRAHRLRNRAHPVPDLASANDRATGGWWEAPFWIWTTNDPVRKALYAQQQGKELVLSDQGRLELRLPNGRILAELSAALGELAARGIKLRTRALTTTLFARLLLADLFIHGIGGAKYDAVTDEIMRAFFNIDPPKIAVVSATLRLPIARPSVTVREKRRLQQRQRDMKFNPQRFLSEIDVSADDVSSLNAFLLEKQRLIAMTKTPTNARERHTAICDVNQSLQFFLAGKQAELQSRLMVYAHLRRASTILGSREYAFCLFPERQLKQLLLDSWQLLP